MLDPVLPATTTDETSRPRRSPARYAARRRDSGTATAEYTVGTVGAIGVGCILIALANKGVDGEFLGTVWERVTDGLSSTLSWLPDIPVPW